MRVARDLNAVSSLIPEHHDLRDLPYPLFEALRHALIFLSFDELPEDERPPKRIWLDGERMREWMEDVRRRRKQRYEGGDSNREVEDPVQNEAARGLVVG